MVVVYPVHRLLANPRVFSAISNHLGGFPVEYIRDAFYNLLEFQMQEDSDEEDFSDFEDSDEPDDEDLDEIEEFYSENPSLEENLYFGADEVSFRVEPDLSVCYVSLDTGLTARITQIAEEEGKGVMSSAMDFMATSTMNQKLIDAIVKSHPELKWDIALSSPPTPSNNFLSSKNGDNFEGIFHLLSDPKKEFSFTVDILDTEDETLHATIKPLT